MDKEELEEKLRELFPNGHPGYIPLSLEEIELHSTKNSDYARGNNPLGNFYRVANILSNYKSIPTTPIGVSLVYMLKQLDAAIYMLTEGYEGDVEGIAERLRDVAVYAKIALLMSKDESSG